MDPPQAEFTTNAKDQAETAKLKARLSESNKSSGKKFRPLTSVKIADGAWKYVLISALAPDSADKQHFVTSKRGASYHRNAADPFVLELEEHGYTNIEVNGGGRIMLDEEAKKISIFGFSYGFGPCDHEISKRVVKADIRYADFNITTSQEGY